MQYDCFFGGNEKRDRVKEVYKTDGGHRAAIASCFLIAQ